MHRLRSTWITPRGVASPPTGGRARLAPLKVKSALSRDRPKLSFEGRFSPIRRRKRDRTRVSLLNRPSAPPSTSPQASATRKVSPSLIDSSCPRSSAETASSASERAGPARSSMAPWDLGALSERRRFVRLGMIRGKLGGVGQARQSVGVEVQIAPGHGGRREPPVESPANFTPVEILGGAHRQNCLIFAVHHEPG